MMNWPVLPIPVISLKAVNVQKFVAKEVTVIDTPNTKQVIINDILRPMLLIKLLIMDEWRFEWFNCIYFTCQPRSPWGLIQLTSLPCTLSWKEQLCRHLRTLNQTAIISTSNYCRIKRLSFRLLFSALHTSVTIVDSKIEVSYVHWSHFSRSLTSSISRLGARHNKLGSVVLYR